jgi:hypothetical protein
MLPPKSLSYVFFNNITMFEDAVMFKDLVERP